MTVRLRTRPPRPRPSARLAKAAPSAERYRTIRKFPDDEFWRALQQAADEIEPDIRERFLEAVRAAVAGGALPALERALAAEDMDAALAALGLEEFERSLEGVQEQLLSALVAGARAAARTSEPSVGLELSFDLTNPEAVAWVEAHAAEVVREVTTRTQEGIREIIRRGFAEGLTPRRQAQLLLGRETGTPLIGLTERQARAVANFRQALLNAVQDGGTPADLRSRFRLSPVQSAGQIRPDNVDALTARYADRLLRHRARTIARHESIVAARQGQRQLWIQAVDDGLLDPEEWEREWVAVVPSDGRTCAICIGLDGSRAPIDGTFPNGSTTAEGHIICRCAERLVRIPPGHAERRRRVVQAWTRGSRSKRSITLQHAAIAELGVPGSVYNPGGWVPSDDTVAKLQPVVRRMYEDTQRALGRRGVESITLYRGIKTQYRRIGVMESWTSDRATAEGFGPLVIEQEIPVGRVLMWHEGPGWEDGPRGNEFEWVILSEVPE